MLNKEELGKGLVVHGRGNFRVDGNHNLDVCAVSNYQDCISKQKDSE